MGSNKTLWYAMLLILLALAVAVGGKWLRRGPAESPEGLKPEATVPSPEAPSGAAPFDTNDYLDQALQDLDEVE